MSTVSGIYEEGGLGILGIWDLAVLWWGIGDFITLLGDLGMGICQILNWDLGILAL